MILTLVLLWRIRDIGRCAIQTYIELNSGDRKRSTCQLVLGCTCVQVLEIWLNVQRKWMYLEGIFIGGDIRLQLPDEAKMFDQVRRDSGP